MSWSFPIGRLFGSELRVHATFFLLLVWIGVSAWSYGGAEAAAVNITYILALFACVIAHEYGHALTARRFGIRTPDITLLPIGGLARLERMPEKPMQEILVALAGPAVNVVIFAVLWVVIGLSPQPPLSGDMSFATLPRQIATLNLVLAVFNMIPAFPMDGGRVLRAALALFTDRVRATRIAAIVGQVIAVGGGLYGLWTGQVILVLIAAFIFMAARREDADVALVARIPGKVARDAMVTDYTPLRAGDGLEIARMAMDRSDHPALPVRDPVSGRIVGFATREALDGPGESVADVMERQLPAVTDVTPLGKVLGLFQRLPIVAVVTPQGEFVGFLSQDSVNAVLRAPRGG